MPVIPVVIYILLCILFPRGMMIFFFAPIVGLTVGGFIWCVAAIMEPSLNSLNIFLSFVLLSIAFFEYYFLKD